MKFEDFGLSQDPFPIAPESSVHNWAGDQDLRDEIVDIVKGVRARDIGVTEFAILYGEYGAGKSHALRYLKTLITEDTAEFNSLAIYLDRPRLANKMNFENIAKHIFVLVGRDRLAIYCARVGQVLDAIVQDSADEKGMGAVKDKGSFYADLYSRLREEDRAMVKLLYRGNQPGSRIFEFLTGVEKCDGSEYEGKIDSDYLAAKVLGDFFRVLTLEFPNGTRILESVYLFIDECEMLLEAKTSESDIVFTGLRELVNSLPYMFCLMMSFTAATALIEAVMPTHLLKRLTRTYLEVPMLSDEMALEFLKGQLDFYRPEGSPHAHTFYPFSPEAAQVIVDNEISITPRNLFIQCKRVFERSIRRHGVLPGEEITEDLARTILGIG